MIAADRELTRLRYLSAMGVVPLVTRRTLPGAAATRKLALRRPPQNEVPFHGEPSDGQKPSTPGTQGTPGTMMPRELRALLKPESAADVTVPAPQTRATPPAPEPSPSAEAASPVDRFRLSAIICGGRLWLEDLGDGALAREQLELITGMARALVHPTAVEAPQVHQFDWPMHNNEHLNLGREEAAASLQGFLSRQLDEHACVELICLGDVVRERTRSLNLPCATIALPTTRVLLEEPQRKRDAWRDLRRP